MSVCGCLCCYTDSNMSLIIMSSDILLERMENISKRCGERNMRLLQVLGRAGATKFGDDYKGHNEVTF